MDDTLTLALDPVFLDRRGAPIRLRPVRASDGAPLREMFERCSPDDLRLRCLGVCKGFPADFAARLAALGGEAAEFAIAALLPSGEIGGVVHVAGARDGTGDADYDIMVRSDLKGRGIGARLMRDMLREAARRGFRAIGGDVSLGNRAMLLLAGDLGFRRVGFEGGVVRIEAASRAETELVARAPA